MPSQCRVIEIELDKHKVVFSTVALSTGEWACSYTIERRDAVTLEERFPTESEAFTAAELIALRYIRGTSHGRSG